MEQSINVNTANKIGDILEEQPTVNNIGGNSNVKDGIIDFIAGSLGGISLVYVGQPLDTIKVKMQTFPAMYKNMFTCFTQTLQADGLSRGLYAGTTPALVANITENSVLFLCYGFCQKFIQKIWGVANIQDLTAFQNASAGFFASFFSSLALCPTELVKCKLQAMHEINKQAIASGVAHEKMSGSQIIRNIAVTEGAPGFFRGLVPTLAREMPGYFVFFGAYEAAREILAQPGQRKDDIGLLNTMAAGAFGGAAFWTLTYPIDVAKSRIQVTNTKRTMIQTIAKCIRQEGVLSLYNGLTPTLVRTVPATAALFVTYEYSKMFFHKVC